MPAPRSSAELPRVCILLADSGGGHRTAATSLAEALSGSSHVELLNLLDDCAPFPFNHVSSWYGPLVNHAPRLYAVLYRATAGRRRVELARRACTPLVWRRIDEAIRRARPDLIISVHPLLTSLPLAVVRQLGRRVPFLIVVTDPVTAHPAWFPPDVDLCVVASEAARTQALACGCDAGRVRVIGLPVRAAFTRDRGRTKAEARAQLGLAPELPLILLSGGGAGVGQLLSMPRSVAHRLAGGRIPAQMAVVSGRNEGLLRRLQAEPWPIPVTCLGYVERMADWLAAADLLICKAGPGTLAEAACMGVPMLITGYIPGQETGNVRWVEDSGAGVFEPDCARAASLVAKWLAPDDATLARMSIQARAIAHPDAAPAIARTALAMCEAV